MGARHANGFTIIETMLFLAVTGLLVMGALVGTGVSLNNQRYRDAVETFKNLIQSQYDELGSVKNDRANTLACDNTAQTVEGAEIRGQSDCVIVGRFMALDGGNTSIYTVLAREVSSADDDLEGTAALGENYVYSVTPETETHTMEWRTAIANPNTLGLLFLRSPTSGTIYTFSSDKIAVNNDAFVELITGATSQDARTVCVQSPGLRIGGDMGIYIGAAAAGASAVELRTNETATSIDGEGAVQC